MSCLRVFSQSPHASGGSDACRRSCDEAAHAAVAMRSGCCWPGSCGMGSWKAGAADGSCPRPDCPGGMRMLMWAAAQGPSAAACAA